MGRRLPWKRSEPDLSIKSESPSRINTKPSTPRPVATPQPRRVAQAPSSDRLRSPSTSPPPEPPIEQLMIPGDERYRMVEDEFLLIAQRFTTHLHRAEYNRLKALAKSQNADAIRQIERPVAGPPTRIAKRRHEAISRATKQRDVLEAHGDEVSDLPGMGTGLRGLMESPKREARTIRSFASSSSRTKAAAAHGSQVGSSAQKARSHVSDARPNVLNVRDETDGETDDDLGSRPSYGNTSRLPVNSTASARSGTFPKSTATPQVSRTMSRPKSEPNLKRSRQNEARHSVEVIEDDDDDDLFGIRKRQIRRAKSREQFQKASEQPSREKSPNSIPAFL